VYTDLDKQINDLEKLYSATAPGLEKEKVGELLPHEGDAPVRGVVFLAYEQKDWNGVLGGESHAREVIAGTRHALESARPLGACPDDRHGHDAASMRALALSILVLTLAAGPAAPPSQLAHLRSRSGGSRHSPLTRSIAAT
jgi:hypothetical protein